MSDRNWARVGIDAQSVDAPLSRAAVFLVVTVGAGDDDVARVRDAIGGVDDLVKTVGFRDLNGRLSCVVGIGAAFWDRLVPDGPRPRDLRAFARIEGPKHVAVSTPGDVLFHIRAERDDMCFELERLLLESLGGAVRVEDETVGFRYFDARDLLGFVDGTANPTGAELPEATFIAEEDDPAFAGGTYVVVQKYVHDIAGWQGLATSVQEGIIGRTKLDNVELDDDGQPQLSHKSLSTVVGPDGDELSILRDNMPFGRPGQGEFGTYFIGYTGRLWVLEKMLERMFLGAPEGAYDRLLDFSTALTGSLFFVPPLGMLGDLAEGAVAAASADATSDAAGAAPAGDGDAPTLGIGSLRG
jgi:porphyrinogen peroxidase